MRKPIRPTAAEVTAFDRFWASYDHKIGKAEALALFITLLRSGASPERIISAAAAEARRFIDRGIDPMYRAHAKTWLRNRVYEDDRFDVAPAVPSSPAPCPVPGFEGLDPTFVRAWILPCAIEREGDRVVALVAPSRFHADRLRDHLAPEITQALGHMPRVMLKGER